MGDARVCFLERSARRLTLMRKGQLVDFLRTLRSGARRKCARTPDLAGWLCVPEGPQVQPCHSDHGSGAATIQQHVIRRTGAIGQEGLVPLIPTGYQRRPEQRQSCLGKKLRVKLCARQSHAPGAQPYQSQRSVTQEVAGLAKHDGPDPMWHRSTGRRPFAQASARDARCGRCQRPASTRR